MSDTINISTLTDASDHTVLPRSVITSEKWNNMSTNFKTKVDNLNDAVTDLENNYAGTSAPSNKPEGKIWCDTTNDPAVLKFYKDGSNNTDTVSSIGAQQTFSKGQTITIADTTNQDGLTINQNDTTNNKIGEKIVNAGTGNGLFIDQNGAGVAINIDSEATTADVINLDSAMTTGIIVDINAEAITEGTAVDINDQGNTLTTGKLVNILSNSADTGTRSLVKIQNDNTAATGTTTLEVINDSTGAALKVTGGMTMPRNAGLVVKWINTTSDNDVDIDADYLTVFDTNNLGIVLSSVNRTTDSSASAGINAIDTGDFAAATWYFLYVIYNATTATTACLASLSATAPTMPSGYTFKKLVGAVYCVTNTADVVFYKFYQRGNFVQYWNDNNDALHFSTTSATFVAKDLSAYVPSIARTFLLNWEVIDPTSGIYLSQNSADSGGGGYGSGGFWRRFTGTGETYMSGYITLIIVNYPNIYIRVDGGTTFSITVTGIVFDLI